MVNGLLPQTLSCCLNAVILNLFFIAELRKSVFQLPIDSSVDDKATAIALAIQRIFFELEFSDEPPDTTKLANAMLSDPTFSMFINDAQMLLRVTIDLLDTKMKQANTESTASKLFEGKLNSYVRCTKVKCEHNREEPFWDVQLKVEGFKSLEESLRDFVAVERLVGDKAYNSGSNGLQPADKGVIFRSLPPVLSLLLMRSYFNPSSGRVEDNNERFEFPRCLNLDPFIELPSPTQSANYTLHSVLAYVNGSSKNKHIIFVDPKCERDWLRIEDDRVKSVPESDAIDGNFGGHGDRSSPSTVACQLVYVRDIMVLDVLN